MKYADSKSKTFKKYEFTFSGAILKYFKDAKVSNNEFFCLPNNFPSY